MSVKKTIYTLNIGDYSPDITALTYPLIRRFAAKIGADFRVISERRWPEYNLCYEKLQIYELGRDSEWNIYIDGDTLVHPDFFDITEHLPKNTVLHNGYDMAGNRWRYDDYFRRDGRHIGSCNWFTVTSDWCMDLWRPLDDISYEDAVANIFPINEEIRHGMKPGHFIDEYVVSRNIARFGLKFDCLIEMLQRMKRLNDKYLWHEYRPIEVPDGKTRDAVKVRHLLECLSEWHLMDYIEGTMRLKTVGNAV